MRSSDHPVPSVDNVCSAGFDKPTTAHKPRLVLAEDEPSLCHFLGELLASEYAVELAMDGQQAWDAIQQARPDVVLSNVNMPELDGLALVRRMRSSPVTANVPVLLLSARANRAVQAEAAATGASGWMQKPFRLAELLAALRRLVSPPGIADAP